MWDAISGRQLAKLEGHTDDVKTAAFSPDGKRVVTARSDSTAAIYKIVAADDVEKLFSKQR